MRRTELYHVSRGLVLASVLWLAACGGGGGGDVGGGGSVPIAVAPTAPGAPVLTSALPGNGAVTLAFTAPAATGGATITSYTARCTAGAASGVASGPASPLTVTGLPNGVDVSCVATAANSAGAGPASTPLSLTLIALAPTPAGIAEFTTLDLATPPNYANPALPAYYDATVAARDNTPASAPVRDRIAVLGRVLFHDPRLSVNNTVACGSCHRPARGFGDAQRFSPGFNGVQFTSAHSMRLGNVRYYQPGTMFWNKRAATLEDQAVQPIQDPIEMGWTSANGGLPVLFARMGASSYYPDLFTYAFGSPAITQDRVQQALAQFQRSMISSNSKWDAGYASTFNPAAPNRNLNAALANFTAEENRGRQIFFTGIGNGGGGCNGCHEAPTFALDANSRSNGLDAGETRIFKSPSLKNVGLGGPYMHDGRFATLEEVVDFYDRGIQAGPALDQRLRDAAGQPIRLNLSPADRAALAAFLRTLDDPTFIADAKFASPFKK
jgi:cytochrome c peroxidase